MDHARSVFLRDGPILLVDSVTVSREPTGGAYVKTERAGKRQFHGISSLDYMRLQQRTAVGGSYEFAGLATCRHAIYSPIWPSLLITPFPQNGSKKLEASMAS